LTEIAAWRAAIARASGAGDHLQAIDLATRALQEHPKTAALAYQRLLSFARAGAGRRAANDLAALEREGTLQAIEDPRLRTDFAALKGRLLKDRAMRATDAAERARLAAAAAAAYESVFVQSQNCFPAVNAATLWRIAGAADRAAAMAHCALDCATQESDEYWRLATVGEARVLLGDEADAVATFRAAAAAGAGRLDAMASTRRQLAWLARACGIGQSALAAMPAPLVLHWLADPGDIIAGDIDVPARIVAHRDGRVAFGTVVSAADVAIAEALRELGADLHLVLPCGADICRAFLARHGGAALAERFDALLHGADTVSIVTPDGDPGEPTVLHQALRQARGQALLRGAALLTPVEVLVCVGRHLSLRDPAPDGQDLRALAAAWPDIGGNDPVWSRRSVRAIVFGDVQGFSGIAEVQHAAFLDTVVGGFAAALATLSAHVEYAETAGDGLYIVLSDVVSAVHVCHALHRSIDPARLAAAGLPTGLLLRLSAHVGPVFRGLDRVINRQKFFGKEVIRTARIEPVTPPGETYVTEQFAAALYCEAGARYECEYVGNQPMAKGFGECRMYSLREKKEE
jgi:hypothetical protein